MKKIAYFTAVAAMLVGFSSCNDEFLELTPKGSITDATAFTSYESCSAYLLTLYDMFGGSYGNIFPGPAPVVGPFGTSTRDLYSGLLNNYGPGDGTIPNSYADQTITIPTTSNAYSLPYQWIRKANIMLAHIDEPNVSDAQRKHIESLSRFFKAYAYFCLLANYGDVIYVDEVLNESSEELMKSRDSRVVVADKIYNDLLFCEENIQDDLAAGNTINSTVVKAFLSRFCLFEGTWRKYHNIADEQGCVTRQQLLQKCLEVSKEIADRNIPLYTGDNNDKHPGKGWGQMWTTEDLSKVPSVFLYVKYVDNIKMHRLGHYEHIASASLEMPQSTVDLYLTRDGLPIHNSGVKYYKYDSENGYTEGEKYDYANCEPYKTFRMRDPRLWQMVTPPYHVNLVGKDKGALDNNNAWVHDLSHNGKYDEYVSQFAPRGKEMSLNDGTAYWWCPNFNTAFHQIESHKSLPSSNWAGNILINVPNIKGGASKNWTKEATQYKNPKAFQQGRSGYFVWKHVANWDRQDATFTADVAGKPQFKLEEVLLNYAEAAFELGKFDQGIADATINKLRVRAEVGKMNVSVIDDSFDPDRDKTVDPVLWEIRRERLIELMGESFSFEDVRRWKKADWFVNKQVCGVWVDADNIKAVTSKTGGSTGVLSAATKLEATPEEVIAQGGGHVYFYLDPVKAGKGWKAAYYLQPIPSEEGLLNPNLGQNDGY